MFEVCKTFITFKNFLKLLRKFKNKFQKVEKIKWIILQSVKDSRIYSIFVYCTLLYSTV